MKNIIKSVGALVLMATLFTGCVDSDKDYDSVNVGITTYNFTKTKEVSEVNAMATASTQTAYTADDIIEAYVTSNDAGGNFYKSISFQTMPTDASAPIGFSVPVDDTMLFVKGFTPGRKVFIKLQGLAISKVFGSMQIGVLDPANPTSMGRIPELEFENHLFPSDVIVSEDSLVRVMTLAQAVTDANQNTLVELTTVEFADNSLGRTYFDVDSGGSATNQNIVDYTLGGKTQFLRVSSFAPFSTGSVPVGRGNIRGVMTKYNSDYQFLVRSAGDFKLTQPRTYTFFSSLNENFSSYSPVTSSFSKTAAFIAFPNYINFATEGSKKWFVKSGGFLEMSSFSGDIEKNKAYFIIPVNMTDASTFKFDLTVAFFQASLGLKVYRSSDYVPGKNIKDATLYDISTAFSSGFPTANATITGLTYNIPAEVTGNGYFIFEYTGTNITTGPVVTTTIDIDNIAIN